MNIIERFKINASKLQATAQTIGTNRDCGLVTDGVKAYQFSADMAFIYMNGEAVLYCYNDRWTAIPIFIETMIASCDQYQPPADYVY